MPANTIVPKNPQTDNRKQTLLTAWLNSTQDAIEALFTWQGYLQTWRHSPQLEIPDEQFMGLVQDMNEAGLLEWLDANQANIDQLRAIMTPGGEK